MKSCKKRLKV
ncbi:hypothetical protein Patl1_33552 [Pistacia atlantica]|uniref:Uncharacterized protein n=1 Tax=Pistacia atlantica TaxID=434234 RepID=A0ACC0ZU15_9ROSI|nr:hypothetical protein Patl1_33552 [Pistacia atlantica]